MMAIPLIIAGAVALVGGGLGLGAMASAKEKSDEAKEIYSKKNKKQKAAGKKLEKQQDATRKKSEELGLLKLNLQNNELAKFVELYEKLAALNIKGFKNIALKFDFTPDEIKSMKRVSMNASEVLSTGVQSLAGGALAGAGVYGSVMALGAASTGTAITSLSGVAATNATMAWLGGGSLAAGGAGMAGGAFAIGGFVAGPAILIAGAIADSKAEKALTEAKRFGAKVDVACEKMKTEGVLVAAVEVRCNEFITVLSELKKRLSPRLLEFEAILSGLKPKQSLSDDQHKVIHATFLVAKTIKDVMNTSIVESDGKLNPEGNEIEQSLEGIV
jgi:hypothetical protein